MLSVKCSKRKDKKMSHVYDVIVIGGGASGLMAAGRAAERGRRVLLLEKNNALGVKLALTGGGRCNICNAEENKRRLLKNYGAAEKFLYSPFSQFGVDETFRFFSARGLPLKVEENNRVFPKTEKASDVIDVLARYVRQGKGEIRKRARVGAFITKDKKLIGVKVNGEVLAAQSYVLATGGKSHPETGSTGDGFGWLAKLGHEVKEPKPTVVPLSVKEGWIKSLAGVVLKNVKVTFFLNSKKRVSERGNILCTHFGISGPLILNLAGRVSYMLYDGAVTATIDLFPQLDHGALDKRITQIFDEHKNKTLKNIMNLIVPPGTASAMLSLRPQLNSEKKVHSILRQERKDMVQLLKNLPLTITGLMGFERAVVTNGGLAISEVDGKTMRSRKHLNLFVTGDLIDISRPSGGYSLQLCWTTGWVAGSNA